MSSPTSCQRMSQTFAKKLEVIDAICRLPRNATRLIPLALHAGLSTDEQLRVFEAPERGTRKVIISTNIAEVSDAAYTQSFTYAYFLL